VSATRQSHQHALQLRHRDIDVLDYAAVDQRNGNVTVSVFCPRLVHHVQDHPLHARQAISYVGQRVVVGAVVEVHALRAECTSFFRLGLGLGLGLGLRLGLGRRLRSRIHGFGIAS